MFKIRDNSKDSVTFKSWKERWNSFKKSFGVGSEDHSSGPASVPENERSAITDEIQAASNKAGEDQELALTTASIESSMGKGKDKNQL